MLNIKNKIVEDIPFCLFTIPKNWKKMVWEITSQCNMNCLHCCVNAHHKLFPNEFIFSNSKLIKKRIDEMISFGISEFYISGGEPFLVKNIFDILKYLKRKKAKVSIATNGYFLEEKIIKKLSKIKIDLLHISLDGHLPEIHNALRGEGFFDKVVKNIVKARKHKIPIRIGCIIWSKNENLLEEMVKFCAKLRIKELRLGWLIKVGRFKQNPKIYPKRKWASVMREIKELREKYKNKIEVSIHRDPFIKISNTKLCPAGEKLFFLDSERKLSPCSWIGKIDPNFTTKCSLKEMEFEELVKSKPILKFRKLLIERRNKNFKGCPFISKYQNHSYYSKDDLINL